MSNYSQNTDIIINKKLNQEESFQSRVTSPLGRSSPREHSASEKWANNEQLALEYLKRQKELISWMEKILEKKLLSDDLFEALRSGIILRELMDKIFSESAGLLSPISRKYNERMAPWKERENISIFLKQCRLLGISDYQLFCTDDLYEGSNMVQVLFGLHSFVLFSKKHLDEIEISQNQPHDDHDDDASLMFSSREIANAMSKIESSGAQKSLESLITETSKAISSSTVTDSPIKDRISLSIETEEVELSKISLEEKDKEKEESINQARDISETVSCNGADAELLYELPPIDAKKLQKKKKIPFSKDHRCMTCNIL